MMQEARIGFCDPPRCQCEKGPDFPSHFSEEMQIATKMPEHWQCLKILANRKRETRGISTGLLVKKEH